MNWSYIIRTLPLFLRASAVTVQLAAYGIVLSAALGALVALALYYRLPVLRSVARAYVELSRNTPLLVQLFFLYFGLPQLGVHLSGFACGVIGLGFLGGSYMAESFRAGLEAVPVAQIEAARGVGFSELGTLRFVIVPQAWSVSLPSIAANAIFLLKETSICGAIAIPDLVHTANDQIGMYYKTYEALLMLTVSYVVLILPLSYAFTRLERRARHAEFGN
jgi:polar amino acid transport system permease protein